jgi:hypothetical protein
MDHLESVAMTAELPSKIFVVIYVLWLWAIAFAKPRDYKALFFRKAIAHSTFVDRRQAIP